MQTGSYTRVGLIERVARFLDGADGQHLFDDDLADVDVSAVVMAGGAHPALRRLDVPLIDTLLRAARRMERITRHKFNPAIPMLGDRSQMVASGILTDDLG